jgi:protein SCO1
MLGSLALLAGLAIAAILWSGRPGTGSPKLDSGIAMPKPRPLPEFTLFDQHSRPFTRAALEGRWTLLFAGFTHCPDICPSTLATLSAVDRELGDAGQSIQVLLLSLDPERDGPDTLQPYLAHFNPRFLGVTGEIAEIDRLMTALGLAYIRVPTSADGYTIDHSTALVLIDPRASVVGYFKAPLRPEAIAGDLRPVLTGAR